MAQWNSLMRMARWPIGLLAIVALAASAAEIEGVTFSKTLSLGPHRLTLNGVGLMRYRVVFKAFVAALYLGEGARPEQALDDIPRRLEIEYFWSIKGSDFADAAEQILRAAHSRETLQPYFSQIAQMRSLYRDVKPGDRYALTYLPGAGMSLRHNSTDLGTVQGAEFASLYFTIWLGKAPMSASLRDQLLKPTRD